MPPRKKDEHPVAPLLRVAPLGELKVYTVTEDDLEMLGRGSPGSLYLNFGLALLPLGIGLFVAVVTTDIPTLGGQIGFISGCIICCLIGILCLLLARHHHVSTKTLVAKIKSRMPAPEPIAQQATDPPPAGGGS